MSGADGCRKRLPGAHTSPRFRSFYRRPGRASPCREVLSGRVGTVRKLSTPSGEDRMSRKLLPALAGGLLGLGLWAGTGGPVLAQPVPQPPPGNAAAPMPGAAAAPAPLPAPAAAAGTGADIIPPAAGLPV